MTKKDTKSSTSFEQDSIYQYYIHKWAYILFLLLDLSSEEGRSQNETLYMDPQAKLKVYIKLGNITSKVKELL